MASSRSSSRRTTVHSSSQPQSGQASAPSLSPTAPDSAIAIFVAHNHLPRSPKSIADKDKQHEEKAKMTGMAPIVTTLDKEFDKKYDEKTAAYSQLSTHPRNSKESKSRNHTPRLPLDRPDEKPTVSNSSPISSLPSSAGSSRSVTASSNGAFLDQIPSNTNSQSPSAPALTPPALSVFGDSSQQLAGRIKFLESRVSDLEQSNIQLKEENAALKSFTTAEIDQLRSQLTDMASQLAQLKLTVDVQRHLSLAYSSVQNMNDQSSNSIGTSNMRSDRAGNASQKAAPPKTRSENSSPADMRSRSPRQEATQQGNSGAQINGSRNGKNGIEIYFKQPPMYPYTADSAPISHPHSEHGFQSNSHANALALIARPPTRPSPPRPTSQSHQHQHPHLKHDQQHTPANLSNASASARAMIRSSPDNPLAVPAVYAPLQPLPVSALLPSHRVSGTPLRSGVRLKASSNAANSDGSSCNVGNVLGDKPSIRLHPQYSAGDAMRHLLTDEGMGYA